MAGKAHHEHLADHADLPVHHASRSQVDAVVNIICSAARTGEIGDGKIFVSPVAGKWHLAVLQALPISAMLKAGTSSAASVTGASQMWSVSGQERQAPPEREWQEVWQTAWTAMMTAEGQRFVLRVGASFWPKAACLLEGLHECCCGHVVQSG